MHAARPEAARADLVLAAHRIVSTRMLNGGQVCLCPDYVFVPRQYAKDFTAALQAGLARLFPSYTDTDVARHRKRQRASLGGNPS
ncbi:aldehyde dehydrogenase family protein [Streptomyces sp. NBC_00203]|uniref:aldehyde dehydrogenase family protein n=1 Tax=Streptomyces sp. NBC_00203 TaxID=2975680 RepID=UPI00324349E5